MREQKRVTSGIYFLPTEHLQRLFDQLKQAGYTVVAPQQVDGAIVYRETETASTLPQGVVDRQQPGQYRLETTPDPRYFGWSSGVQGVKSALFPPQELLWQSTRQADGQIQFSPLHAPQQPVALFGLRSCDLAAIRLMDKHFLRSGEEDPWYQQCRSHQLLIAVSCSHASESCFCASTATGPEPEQGFDLRLDELASGFLIQAGSAVGNRLLLDLALESATELQIAEADESLGAVAASQKRAIASNDFRPHFLDKTESPIWEQIAERCLGCGNCTALCPTCFCHREEEVATLDLQQSSHQRVWDSCFSDEHSQLHGIPVRTGRRERYRQWMTHKLAGWHDQFGESGCVGCGRCITWCPVGIDLVQESARFVEAQNDA